MGNPQAYPQLSPQLSAPAGSVLPAPCSPPSNPGRAAGKTLLHLNTHAGDPSNILYAALGYSEAGRIPDWARDAAGNLSATVFWYKTLG